MNLLFILITYLKSTLILLLTTSAIPGDFMRETGKIHVVYGVILIIFIGIVLFLIYLERKISKIEKRIYNDEIK